MRCTGRAKDDGSALVAAVGSILVFSYISLQVLAADRGAIASVIENVRHAHLSAAADAGIAMAMQNLSATDPAVRWPIDGRTEDAEFGRIRLSITVEDERGKVALSQLSEDQARSLFAAAGAAGSRMDALVDAFEDWIDDDDDTRPKGAETSYYAPLGLRPRNGEINSVEELIRVKGMDAGLLARIAPIATAWFGSSGGFSPSTAQPLAIAIVTGHDVGSPEVIERQRELAGQRTALNFAPDLPLTGRTLTIKVVAREDGALLRRTVIVEITGDPAKPYWVHVLDP